MAVSLFGNDPVIPSQKQYAAYSLSSTPLQLQFPNDYASGVSIFASFMDITPTGAGQDIKLPNGIEAGVGTAGNIINRGNYSFFVQDFDGNVLLQIFPVTDVEVGEFSSVQFYLVENETSPGTWEYLINGASNSSAQAEDLAGLGLVALPSLVPPYQTVLNTNSPVKVESSNFLINNSYRASVVIVNSGTQCTLENPAQEDGFYFDLINNTSNNFEIDADGLLINGASNLTLIGGASARIVSDGTNYWGYNLAASNSFSSEIAIISITGGTYQIPDDDLASYSTFIFTGTLTSNLTVLLYPLEGEWTIANFTTGVFTLTVAQNSISSPGTPTGTQFVLPQLLTRIYVNVPQTDGDIGSPTLLQIPEAQDITGGFADGSLGSPSIFFTNNTQDGFYLAVPTVPSTVGMGIDGVNVASYSADGITFNVPITLTASFTSDTFLAGNGSVTNPSYSFVNSTGSGLYYDPTGGGNIACAFQGAQVWSADATSLYVEKELNLNVVLGVDFGGTGSGAPSKVGQTLYSQTLGNGIWAGFSIRQIIPVVDTTFLNLSSASTTLPLSGSITLTATNSRVFIMAVINLANSSTVSPKPTVFLQQNSVNLLQGVGGDLNPTFVIAENDVSDNSPVPYSVNFLTNVLAAGTYTYSFLVDALDSESNSVWYNRGQNQTLTVPDYATPSTLYLVEIGGF